MICIPIIHEARSYCKILNFQPISLSISIYSRSEDSILSASVAYSGQNPYFCRKT